MKRPLALVLSTILLLLSGALAFSALAFENISPEDAYSMLNPDDQNYVSNTYILDVRTPAEWCWVGHPGEDKCHEGSFLTGKVINIPWVLWEFDPNTKEYTEVPNKFFDEEVARQFKPDDTIIIMCRSGVRSVAASTELEEPSHPACKRLTELGYYRIYNMKGGFEGGTNNCGYRILDAGWKNKGLPYNCKAEGIWSPLQNGRSLR